MTDMKAAPPVEPGMQILVICAHSDDIEFGVGGSVAKWVKAGAEVHYVVITDNSAGSNDPDTDLEELVQIRIREQMAAAEKVGVTDVRFLGYKDGTLEPTMELRCELTRIIREIRPYRVIIMDPATLYVADRGYINHPDHRAAGEAAMYAVFPSAGSRPIFPELLDEGFEPHDVTELFMTLSLSPNTYVDITDTIDAKTNALRVHASQLNEEVVQMVRGWSEETGKEVGVSFAETFRVMRLRDGEDAKEEQEALS